MAEWKEESDWLLRTFLRPSSTIVFPISSYVGYECFDGFRYSYNSIDTVTCAWDHPTLINSLSICKNEKCPTIEFMVFGQHTGLKNLEFVFYFSLLIDWVCIVCVCVCQDLWLLFGVFWSIFVNDFALDIFQTNLLQM